MKGALSIPKPKFLLDFIVGLDSLAKKNFPVSEVLAYLKASHFQEDLLEPYTFFSEKRYTRNLLHKRPEYEVLLLCWMPNQISPIHGHEGEKCWMRVESGELYFTNYVEKENASGEVTVEPLDSQVGGQGFVDGPAIIHRVANQTLKPAMSLHLYAKPFAQCDVFDEEKHLKTRIGLGYDSVDGKRATE